MIVVLFVLQVGLEDGPPILIFFAIAISPSTSPSAPYWRDGFLALLLRHLTRGCGRIWLNILLSISLSFFPFSFIPSYPGVVTFTYFQPANIGYNMTGFKTFVHRNS